MIGILPGRLATRQRLLAGALVVALVSILNLVSFNLGPVFSAPWPIALLWAISGWSKLGANVSVAVLIFVLGCWVDVLTGSAIGTWALTALATLGLLLLLENFLGFGGLGPMGGCALAGALMLAVTVLIGFWRGQPTYLSGQIVSILVAIGLYTWFHKLFELREIEA